MKNFFKQFAYKFYTPKPKSLSIDESIKALVADHAGTLRGLYILERAYLRAHGTPKGKALIIPGGGTQPIAAHLTRKGKKLASEGQLRPNTKHTREQGEAIGH